MKMALTATISGQANKSDFRTPSGSRAIIGKMGMIGDTANMVNTISNKQVKLLSHNNKSHNYLFVLCDKIIINIATNLKSVLEKENIFDEIKFVDISTWNSTNFIVNDNFYFFVFLPHLLKREIPYERTIAYLLEQNLAGSLNTRYVDALNNNQVFRELLNKSTLFDYSQCNIDVWKKHRITNVKVLMPPVSTTLHSSYITGEYDVLFFGVLNDRRTAILKELRHLNLKVINYNKWGEELIEEIKKAKVVINIHYYDNAILEKPRISETLPYCKMISEMPCEEDIESYHEYKDVIDFVPIINSKSDLLVLVEKITSSLRSGNNKIKSKLVTLKKIKKINAQEPLLSVLERHKSPKHQHRHLCNMRLPLIRMIKIPDFVETSEYETVLIEFRKFSHLEFLLRNTIIKFPLWSHTVVCGNLNEAFIREMCNDICKDIKSSIKIVKLNIDNLTPSDYSSLLSTKDFWCNFTGEKVLVYQEDTMLFHNDISPFLHYDYIGAPWPVSQDDNSYGVGNGGFSLRTKSKMLECIDKIARRTDVKIRIRI